jgi:hypothetical protein
VPLPTGHVGYVRIINIKDGWDLAEVLAVTTPAARFDDAVQCAEALYPPVAFSLRDVAVELMQPVGRTPDFQPDYVNELWYRRGIPGRYVRIRVNQARSEGPLTNAEAATLPDQEFYAFEMMVGRIMERLAAHRTVHEWLASSPDDDGGRLRE